MLSEINADHMLGITGDIKELENMLGLSRNPSLIPTLKRKLKVFFHSLCISHTCQMFN